MSLPLMFWLTTSHAATFAGLGGANSGGAGFKSLTDVNLVVDNVLISDGSELYWNDNSTSTKTLTIKTDGVDAATVDISAFTIYAFPGSGPGITIDASSTVVFKDSGGAILQTMTLNSTKLLINSIDFDLFTFFENNTASPVNGVAQIDFNLVIAGCCANANSFSNFTFKNITYSNVIPPGALSPTITSATYDNSTGQLVVTGTNFVTTAGVINDVIANKFTFTGEGGASYTLTDTANVEISSANSFTLTLSAADRAGVNTIANKNSTSSTGGTSYNLAGAAGFIADASATADLTGNTITASNVPLPTISNATYNASTGALAVAGSGFTRRAGATNDIVANKFTLTGEGGGNYTLTDTSNVEITSGTSFTLTLSATDKASVNNLLNKNGTSSSDFSTYNLAAADDWAAGADGALNIADTTGNGITASNLSDSDATVSAGSGVSEPIAIDTTLDSVGEAINIFDFVISDGGTADGSATNVTEIRLNTSGTIDPSKLTFRLNGPDAINVSGSYSSNVITFAGLSLSIADGANETYTVNAYYNDNSNLTEGQTLILSVDGDSDLTLGSSGSQMSATSAVTNSTGSSVDVVATAMVFSTQPAGSVSGFALTTQPVVRVMDAFGNTDTAFTETITLTEASAGSLTGGSVAAVAGVATFTAINYTATADQQSFTITANDQDGVGSNLQTVSSNPLTSDVVATTLVFDTQPSGSVSGVALSTQPVVKAVDANGVTDTGFTETITLTEASAGSLTGGSVAAVAGVATFTALKYTATDEQQSFTISANDQDGIGANFGTVNANVLLSDIVATQLVFTTQPSGSVSGSDLTTQPVVTAQDANGIIDTGFTETITLTEASAGSLSGGSVAAVAGVATFTAINYTATADQQSFTITANDQDGVGSNLQTVSSNPLTSDVVATTLVFDTQPSGSVSGVALSTQPVVKAVDANGVTDTGFTETITFTENGSGVITGDAVAAVAGVATFTALTYTATADQELFTLTANDQDGVGADFGTVNANALVSDIVATQLIFTTQPSGSVSGSDLTTQPVVTAQDTDGNTDIDFNETITLTEASAGSLSGGSVAAVAGVATFTALNYSATADQQHFVLTANDQDGVGTNMSTTDANPVTSDVVATGLYFSTQPAGSISGLALTTQPVVRAVDGNGILDAGFTETITFTENGSGVITGGAVTAVAGVATFTALTYTATADQELFTLTANDQDGVGADFGTVNANVLLSDIVATQLVFTTQPTPLSLNNGVLTPFTTVPTIEARDAANLLDTGYAATITLAEVNGTGSAIFNGTGDTDGNPATVSLTPNAGVATFTGLQGKYTLAGATSENFNLQASSGALTDTNSSQLTAIADAAVTSVNIPTNGTYGVGQILTFTVKFDENITVNTAGGTPQIAITLGSTTYQAIYQSGSGTNTLAFSYLVKSGDSDSDGITIGALNLNGGTLIGAEGNFVQLSLNNVGVTTGVLVDAAAPTVSSVSVPANATYITGQNLDFTINFNEDVTVNTAGGTPQLAITVGTTARQATYMSGSGSSALLFRYTIQTGESDSDGIAIGALSANGGTLRDAANNNASLTLNNVGATASVLVDAVTPVVAEVTAVATPSNDTTPNVTISTSEAGTLNVGGSCGSSDEGTISSGNSTITLTQTDNITVLNSATYSDCTITVTDAAGNSTAPVTLTSFTIDQTPSSTISVTVPANATYIAGQNLDFTVNFDENITVNTVGGTPQLAITIGATTRQATYQSGSGTNALLFRYTVQTGEDDSDGIAISTFTANGGILKDHAGNDATLTLNNVGSTVAVLIDAAAPNTASVTVPANATYVAGQNIDFTINFDENVTVNTTGGTPQLAIMLGSIIRQATYISGSGSSALLFRYTIQAGDSDSDGIAIGALSANGGTLKDTANNNTTLTLNNVGTTLAVLVDTTAPTTASVTVPANASYIAGQSLDFTINFNEDVTVNTAGGTPQLAITVGTTARQATYMSGSGSSALLFRYTIQTGESDSDGIAIGALSANGGTLRDAANNNASLTLNNVGATASVLVDAVTPVVAEVTAVATPSNDTTPNVTISTSEAGTLNVGGSCGSSDEGTISSGNSTITLTQTDNITVLSSATYSDCTITVTDAAGNSNAPVTLTSFTIDQTPSSTISVTVPANATYIAGQNLDFTVNFDENITVNTVGGTPQLAITIGATTRQATYQSGSGTNALLFRYTVQTGEDDSDGIAISTFTANGGILKDPAGNDATLTLNNVGSTVAVLIDAAAPNTASVTVPANATYVAGQNIDFTINFDENVTVNTTGGTPQLAIMLGSIIRQATYISGSGSSALLFRYTIQAGDSDSDGIAIGALSANGGTLKDTANNNTTLTLNNVGTTLAVLVDTTAPTTASVTVPANASYIAGQSLDFTINFNEDVTVNTAGGTPQLAITVGTTTRQATYMSGSGSSALLFRYTIQTGESDSDGIAIGALSANGGTLRDAASNSANLTLNSVGATASVLVDAVTPVVAEVTAVATPSNDTTPNVTISTSEAGTLNVGGSCGSSDEGTISSGNSTITLTQTDNSTVLSSGTYSDCTITVTDAAGNSNAPVTLTSFTIDQTPSSTISVTVPANATYIAGQNLDFTVNFDENITVNTVGGTPQLAITIGATTRQATYQSGSGTNALLFRYTVQTGEDDSDGIAISTFTANGGILKDPAGNDATLTLNNVGSTVAVLIDAAAPNTASVTVPANATYVAGQNIDFTINFDENVTVNTTGGTPQLAIMLGSIIRQATYISGSGSSALLFRYTIQAGDSDSDGIAIGALSANGGTLKDTANNNTTLTLNNVGTTLAVLVDTTAPTTASVTVPANASYIAGQSLDFTINFNEDVTVNTAGGTPQLAITVGTTARQATYMSGSGSSALLFRYTIQTGESDSDGIAIGALSANGGTLRDAANNNASLTLNNVGATASVLVDAVTPVVAEVTAVATPSNDTTPNVTISTSEAGTLNVGGSCGSSDEGTISSGNSTITLTQTDNITVLSSATYSDCTITVTDAAGNSNAPVTLTSFTINSAPNISGLPITSVAQNIAYSFIPTVSDADSGDTATFSINTLPSWATFSTTTGMLSGRPSNNDVGTTTNIIITVSDVVGASDSLPAFNLTVMNVNDAPVINGTPNNSVAQNAVYSFTPTASDIDVGTSLSFSITNQPTWTTFSAVTGALIGTPGNDDVGTTTGVVITVSDGILSASLPAFNITVSNINDAPVISGTPKTKIDENSDYHFTPIVTDVDVNDMLSFTITGHPEWMSFNTATGTLTGTPVQDDVGVTSSITITVNDNSGADNATDSLSFSVEVININQAPVAVADTFELNVNAENSYILDVLSNDTDIDGDALSITGATTSVANVTHDGENLIVNTPTGFVGQIKLIYTITDDNDTFADGSVSLLIQGEQEGTAPIITVPGNVEVNATGLYTKVNLGVATAMSSEGKPIAISLVESNSLFKPGNNTVYWQAIDPKTGLTSIASQQVLVHPLISLGKNQTVVEGKTATVKVILNGQAVSYPFTVALNVSGSAELNDYFMDSQIVTIESGTQADVKIDILQDNESEGNETLTLSVDEGNVGVGAAQTMTIVETNVAPTVTLLSSQNNEQRQLVTSIGGLVTVKANISDANDDNVSTQWIYDSLLNVAHIDDKTITLNPDGLNNGVYRIDLIATDDGDGNLSVTRNLYLSVVNTLAELTDADTDGDRIPDNEEGYRDTDEDGIPDYLDAIPECNVIPEQALIQTTFLVEGESGVCLRKGNTLAAGSTGGLQLTVADLENSIGVDDEAVIVGGIFDYIATGLPESGQEYKVVLPQVKPIPTDAVYRKYSTNLGWSTFVEDANNQLHSAPGTRGYCPAPNSAQWSAGLTEGHWCVRLTIEDGGFNDNDGLANGTIVDPGGVSVMLTSNTAPVAVADTTEVRRNESILIDVLANDTDADQDMLNINAASATFGIVTITSDNLLHYQSASNYIGQDTLVYSLSDGMGGSDSGTVNVTIYPNNAPVAVDDSANTDDRTAIIINVIANDSDIDDDSLTVTSAITDNGMVSINQDNTLTFTPDSGFEGVASIMYIIDDGEGDQATAQIAVTVKAYQSVVVSNKSQGGSMGTMIIALAGFTLFRLRRKQLNTKKSLIPAVALVTIATSFNVAASEPEWFVSGTLGYSKVSSGSHVPSNIGITSNDIDKSDISYSIGTGFRYDLYEFTLNYEQLGEASASYAGDTLDPSLYHQALLNNGPKLVDGLSLQAQYTFWQDEKFSASAGLGLFAWELDYSSKLNDSVIEMNKDGFDVFYNLQLAYAVVENTQVFVKVSRYNLSVNNVNNFSLGVIYDF